MAGAITVLVRVLLGVVVAAGCERGGRVKRGMTRWDGDW